jgi:addiction module HigA family antidote
MNMAKKTEDIKGRKFVSPSTILELNREPTHPGEVLLEEFIIPMNLTQKGLAEKLGVSFRAINEIVNKKRGVSPEMAIRLARFFGTSPEFWLNFQMNYDLWKTYKKLERKNL